MAVAPPPATRAAQPASPVQSASPAPPSALPTRVAQPASPLQSASPAPPPALPTRAAHPANRLQIVIPQASTSAPIGIECKAEPNSDELGARDEAAGPNSTQQIRPKKWCC